MDNIPEVTLDRSLSTDEGTEGRMLLNGIQLFVTLELPWRDNAENTSCIPAGAYTCTWQWSSFKGFSYQVQNVPDRHTIFLHDGLWAGDSALNWKASTRGGILVGMERAVARPPGHSRDQVTLLSSSAAVRQLEMQFKKKPFRLVIHDSE